MHFSVHHQHPLSVLSRSGSAPVLPSDDTHVPPFTPQLNIRNHSCPHTIRLFFSPSRLSRRRKGRPLFSSPHSPPIAPFNSSRSTLRQCFQACEIDSSDPLLDCLSVCLPTCLAAHLTPAAVLRTTSDSERNVYKIRGEEGPKRSTIQKTCGPLTYKVKGLFFGFLTGFTDPCRCRS